jgi:aminoglycoside phosphotransferase (APT) family kinase protein
LRRWETACEDQGLWQFDTTVIHGHMHLSRILFDDHAVSAIDGWSDFHQGDPAADLAWLTLPANSSFAAAVHTSYVASRPGADKWIMQRARFSAELDIAKWLLHGLDTAQDAIVRDATEMLNTLSDRVSTNMEHALTAPVTQIAENPQAS